MSDGFVVNPPPDAAMHGMVVVISATDLMPVNPDVMEMYKKFIQAFQARTMTPTIIITKIDVVSEILRLHPATTFTDPKVKELVDIVVEELDVPPNIVIPVKNYVHEANKTVEMDILHLRALKQIINQARHYLINP